MTALSQHQPLPTPSLHRKDDLALYEEVDGQLRELPTTSILSNRVVTRLLLKMSCSLKTQPLGELLSYTLIHLPVPVNKNRRPDGGFVSATRISLAPPQPGRANAWDIVPELAVEVVSPSDWAEDILQRVSEYFQVGVQRVWVIYPTHRLVYVYDSLRQIRGLGVEDELDGGNILPGFRVPVASLFPA